MLHKIYIINLKHLYIVHNIKFNILFSILVGYIVHNKVLSLANMIKLIIICLLSYKAYEYKNIFFINYKN